MERDHWLMTGTEGEEETDAVLIITARAQGQTTLYTLLNQLKQVEVGLQRTDRGRQTGRG